MEKDALVDVDGQGPMTTASTIFPGGVRCANPNSGWPLGACSTTKAREKKPWSSTGRAKRHRHERRDKKAPSLPDAASQTMPWDQVHGQWPAKLTEAGPGGYTKRFGRILRSLTA